MNKRGSKEILKRLMDRIASKRERKVFEQKSVKRVSEDALNEREFERNFEPKSVEGLRKSIG